LPFGFIFQRDGASAHTASNAALRAELAAGQLSRYHHKRLLASKFVEYKPNELSRMGCNVGDLLQASNKAENKRQTQGSASGYLGQAATETDRQGC